MITLRGFILQASYRVVARAGGARVPVIHLYGRLEEGGTFLVRDDRQRPRFFIPAAAATRARALHAPEPQVIDKRSLDELFLLRVRHSTRGASKRYVGLRQGVDADRVEFIGMEVVRRDWTALAKRVQRELYQRLFADQAVDGYLADIVRRVRNGEFDDELVYRKNLRKGAEDYTATSPPHVVAARKSTQPLGRLVSYVITSSGPAPLDNVQHPLDREHYVLKQIKPVAEPVLDALGLNFERVIGDSRQIDLYSLLGADTRS
jgi:DNA polymerase family B